MPQRRRAVDRRRLASSRRVRRLDARAAGVDVDEVPARDLAVAVERRLDVDRGGGAERGPGELLVARPAQRDRLARGFRETRRFDGGLAGVLAAEPAAEIGDDDADLLLGDVKRVGELAADAEGVLRGRPDRHLPRRPTPRRPPAAPSGVLHVRRRRTSP